MGANFGDLDTTGRKRGKKGKRGSNQIVPNLPGGKGGGGELGTRQLRQPVLFRVIGEKEGKEKRGKQVVS